MLIINTNLCANNLKNASCENVLTTNSVNNKPFSIGANLLYMQTKTCGIYKITSPKKKIYIGQSENIENRKAHYRIAKCSGQPKLYHSIKKYGWDSHKFEILHECSPHELEKLEIYYIGLYQCNKTEFGLNLREGGKTYPYDKRTEIGKKIGDKLRGRKLSLERREKISKSLLGNTRTKGRKLSDREIYIIKKRGLLNGMPKNAREACVKARSVKINQLDVNGVFLKSWKSISCAAKHYGCTPSNIILCLNKVNATAIGFKWEYFDKRDPGDFFKQVKIKKNLIIEKNKNKKKVFQYTKTGVLIKEWDSLNAINENLKYSISFIQSVITEKRLSAYGCVWRKNNHKFSEQVENNIKNRKLIRKNKLKTYETKPNSL